VEERFYREPRCRELARRHDVNANQVFYWRSCIAKGSSEGRTDAQLAPVKVANDRPVEAVKRTISFRDWEPWRSSSRKGRFESLELWMRWHCVR